MRFVLPTLLILFAIAIAVGLALAIRPDTTAP